MSKHESTFSYSVSISSLWSICQQVFKLMEENGWKVTLKPPTELTAKELRLPLMSLPVTIVAILKPVSTNESRIEYVATNSGIGPIQIRACRKVVEDVHQQIYIASEAESLMQFAEQEGMVCPTCGTLIEPGVKYCPNDGTPIGKRCRHCSTNNKPNARFCINCGQSL